ncbi:MAG: PIG-L family deacetylase [Candidatus Omnitrophica bacterium]|nr:PIG-L family deacetylase [Candidatus Omnitrophota bacterium]MBU2063518.1 PIG-L family deacetylase [Candidatus Omnitrophota bacterium]
MCSNQTFNILAIGAHPDDIEFGCGGTLLKYAAQAHNVSLLVLTCGGVGGNLEVRKEEQEEAAKFLGAKEVFWGGFQDTNIPDGRPLITAIENVINKVKPQIVFVNYLHDFHQDHRAAAKACLSATRYIKEVLYYEVPSSQHFEPETFVDISDVLDKKIELLNTHRSQVDRTRVENLTILESAKSCANFRGYQGRVKYAEGFGAVRILRAI